MSAFVGEMSGAVIVMVFNFIILRLTGNIGVAAYRGCGKYSTGGSCSF